MDTAATNEPGYDTDHEVQVAAADPDLDARLAEPTRTLHSRTRATMVPAPVVGDELPAIELDVSLHRVVLNAAATWDWFPGHHNPCVTTEANVRLARP